MTPARVAALQLCPFSSYLEAGLAARFEVLRWYTLDESQRAGWLQQHAETVRAVITGGHIGCSNALMQALPALGIIAVNGVGVDKVDLEYAARRGVQVATTPGALTEDGIAGDLYDIAAGRLKRTFDAQITLFKSVGNAIEDLAAAVAAWQPLKGG